MASTRTPAPVHAGRRTTTRIAMGITAPLTTILLALSAGCQSGVDKTVSHPATPSVSHSHSPSAGPAAPIRFGKRLWSRRTGHGAPDSQPFAVRGVHEIRLVGDLLIYTGDDREGGRMRLVVADAASGVPRWSISDAARLKPGGGSLDEMFSSIYVIGPDSNPLILVEYRNDDDSGGIAALAAASGKVRWRLPNQSRYVSIAAASNDVLVTRVTLFQGTDIVGHRTVAFDPSTRRELWRASGVSPVALADDTLLGDRGESSGHRGEVTTTAVGLDATTGKVRWDMAKLHKKSNTHGKSSTHSVTDGSVALLDVPGSTTIAVDSATGKRLARLHVAASGCSSDGTGLIGCKTDEGSLVLVRRTSDGVQVEQPDGTDHDEIDGVFDGVVFVHGASDPTPRLLDGSGHPYSTRPPGAIAVVGGDYAIFSSGSLDSDDLSLTAHRIIH